jgi:hypothetical protein
VRRPRELFFDEIAVTVAWVGDLRTPNVFRRLEAFGHENYRQLMVTRRAGRQLSFSTDYTHLEGDGYLRQAVRLTFHHAVLDAVRAEYGVRVTDAPHDTTFAAGVELSAGRVQVQGGYSHADLRLAVVSGDRYGAGEHVFTLGSVPVGWDLAIAWFVQKQLDPPAGALNDKRLEVLLTWDVLQTIRRGW